jgi:hypothetical protein
MHRVDQMWEAAAHQISHAYRKVSSYPNSTWDSAARQMRRIRRLYDRQAVRLGVITPPAGMKHGQRGWETSIQLTSQEVDDLAQGLQDHSVAEVNDSYHSEDQIGRLRTTWRIAALTLAHRYHVKVEKWVRKIGLNRVHQ